MSEHEKRLRMHLEGMRAHQPAAAFLALEMLDALLAERIAGLDEAIEFFKEKQKNIDKRRSVAKSLSNAEIADLKTEAGRAGWAAQQLRMEKGRRKKGREKTG